MDKIKLYKQAEEFNKKLFESKERARKQRAKMPIEEKMKELVRLQEIAVTIRPELKKLIPFKL
jgi:hypothetical protein